jgi:hypothetical protein
MGEISPTVLSLCGILLLVSFLIILAGFLMIRVARLGIFAIAMSVIRMLTSPREEPTTAHAQTVQHDLSGDLRARAQSLDFDATVARYEAQESGQPAAVEPDPFVPDTPDISPRPINPSTPIVGRIMRDGRFRRVRGGTPGREADQDFRRVEGGKNDGY